MRVAIIHDFLLREGGAERVLKRLCQMYPDAPVYTLLYDKEKMGDWLKTKEVRTSFLQTFPAWIRKRHQWLLPLMPMAVEMFNLRDFDLVISSSSAFAKGVVVKTKTTHICYMHTPMRSLWDWSHEYISEQRLGKKMKFLARILLSYLRLWDRASADRADYFLANSQYTAERIKKYYRRQAVVVYPPVEIEKFKVKKEHQNYFLTVCRLAPYKRVQLIVEAFKKLKLPLIVVGDGPEKDCLKKIAKGFDNIKILSRVSDEKLAELYENSRAFVFAAEEDFGIAPVEALASGKPVIALKKGGVQETLQAGITGEFFQEPTLELLADGVRRFIEKEKQYDPLVIRKRAEEFSWENFEKNFKTQVEKILDKQSSDEKISF